MIRKSKNLRAAYKKCDHYFSQYIRLKYADKNGYCICATCGHKFHWKDIDCGHYIGRNHKNTRFDERNVRPQCKSCNRFYEERAELGLVILKKLGQKEFEQLIQDGNKVRKWKIWEVDNLSQLFADRIKELKNVKVSN